MRRPISLPLPLPLHDEHNQDQDQDVNVNHRYSHKLNNELESWFRDSKFWGIGSDPIFTVYQDARGNVVRVSVDEDEIVKRSRALAWSVAAFADHEEEEEEGMDVISKIACAKRIADEIEAVGVYTLPRNSSIAKFVAEGSEPSLADTSMPVEIPRLPSLRALPWTGFVLALCSFCVAAKLFTGNGKVELGREEVDMLRRKKKSRMEKDKLDKGSVQVIPNLQEGLLMATDARPQLDRNELMKCIELAEKSGESLVLPDSSSSSVTGEPDFDNKVRQIREMAREARELERQDRARKDKRGKGNELASAVDVSMSRILDDASVEPRPAKIVSNQDNLADHGKEIILSAEIENETVAREISNDTIHIIPDGEAANISFTNTDKFFRNADRHETDTFGSLKALQASVENSAHMNTPIRQHNARNEEVKQNEIESSNVEEKESGYVPSATSSSVRNIPKIIKSVKDAKEYLLEKRRISTHNLQSRKEGKQNCSAAGVSAWARSNDERPDLNISQPKNENIKVVDPSNSSTEEINGDIDSVSLLRSSFANDVSETKSHEVGTRNAVFSMIVEDKALEENNPGLPSDGRTRISEEPSRVSVVEHTSSLHDSVTDRMVHPNNNLAAAVNAENTCPKTAKVKNLNLERALESQETSCDDSPSLASTVGDIKSRVDNGVHDSKELRNAKTFQNGVRSVEESCLNRVDFDDNASQAYSVEDDTSMDVKPFILDVALESRDNHDMNSLPRSENSFKLDSAGPDHETETLESNGNKSWLEDNFQQLDPLIKTVKTGFKENYMLAKENVQQSVASAEISELGLLVEDEELEWMRDDKLREIVFQVRDNELAGRDPFHLMDAMDQRAFFRGLELKAQKVNEKLLPLHEWVHSRIENLDYGADGISLDDPLEKIVPRWKGPTSHSEHEFLDKFTDHEMANFSGNMGQSHLLKGKTQNGLQKSEELPYLNGYSSCSLVNDKTPNGASTSAKTLIESSDGSRRPGKKTGKEHWQHTKKWSRGFLEVYNAETDPEIKSIMKDMGKGLDRWITEKETQEVADLMTRLPKRKQRYIQKKMDKLKREVEMYGAQTVVSKYREYSDENEEDYLWWLDLQSVMCIELYTVEDGMQKIGFYSLGMAADLELHPKQYHVIAFEDPGDSKNFCYIMQAHMDMLGSGRAFVVARPPKDAFREAKANGFNVTVIKKGELKFNVDQTLEEVEEEITEKGSKIYHDKIMQERGVDIRTLMKGVVLADRAAARR